jgi:hypothetical protein
MSCDSINPAQKRYWIRLLVTLAVYAAFLFLALWEFIHHHPAGVLAYALAILPAIPIVGILVILGLYLAEEKDEFLRSLTVQSMLWSLGAPWRRRRFGDSWKTLCMPRMCNWRWSSPSTAFSFSSPRQSSS